MTDRQTLAEQQDVMWRVALRGAGVPEDQLTDALGLAYKVLARCDAEGEDVIEEIHGFGDWTRGYATLAVAEMMKQGWKP
jgi:hypothetical protein